MLRFSIITVVLNDLEGLKRTYRSVAGQTHRGYEWLVLDGGSTDGARDWLGQLEFERLRWWSEPDDGMYHAMNRGIDRGRGTYLIFLNAGDEFADESVLDVVASAAGATPSPHLIFGDALDVTKEGSVLYRKARSHRAVGWTMFACHQAMFFQRERIGDLRYRPWYRNAGDYAFTAEFLDDRGGREPVRVCRLEQPICRFWLGGVSAENRTQTIAEDYLVRARHLGVPTLLNILLFLLHQIHTGIKRALPGLARRIRRQKKVRTSNIDA